MEVSTGSVDTSSAPAESSEGSTVEVTAPASTKERFTYKIDGEDVEEEVDFSDKESLKKRFQLSHAAEKRMSEAKAAKSKAFEIIKAFEEDPQNIFKRLGPKGREVAEKFLLEQIQEEMLSPEERTARDEKNELEKYRSEKKKAQEEAERKESSDREMKYAQDFQNTIITALDKSGLPKSPELVKRMATIMKKNLSMGLELTSDDLVQEVKNDVMGFVKAIIGDSDGDHLIGLFGDDVANKIRKSDLRKLQDKQSAIFQQPTKTTSAPARSKDSRPKSMEEWKRSLEERIK